MFRSIFESSVIAQREKWLSSKLPHETRNAYIDAIGEFANKLKIVAGEANSKLFNLAKFARVIEKELGKNSVATFEMVFHKKDSEDEARDDFRKENPLLVDLRNKYPKQVHFYWAPKRPRQHYAVIDDEMVILEQPHHPAGEPFWATIIRDYEIATDWEKHFDEYVEYCTPMEF